MKRLQGLLVLVALPLCATPAHAQLFFKKTRPVPAQRVPELILTLKTETDERKRKLWSRTPEKIVRAASAFAASRFAKTVEREDMELAQVFMRQSDYVFQIGIKEAEKKRILDHAEIKLEIIRRLKSEFRCEVTDEHGKPVVDEQGNPLVVYEASEAELRRTFRHNTTRRDAFPNAVGDLCDSGTLRREHRKTGGRDKYVLRLMEE